MKNIYNNLEYQQIVQDILCDNNFISMEEIAHHDTNRLDHSLKVSYYSYIISKKLKFNYIDTARGGLLHDYYFVRTTIYKNKKDKIKLFASSHPQMALLNAKQSFDLTKKEMNIIETHMFPLNYKIPKYKESWIVTIVDKVLSLFEFSRKGKKKMTVMIQIGIAFIIKLV